MQTRTGRWREGHYREESVCVEWGEGSACAGGDWVELTRLGILLLLWSENFGCIGMALSGGFWDYLDGKCGFLG